MLIGLRGGHSPNCKGAIGLIDEQVECLKIYNRVAEILRSNGHTVIDCNSTENSINRDLTVGINKANSYSNMDYFLSIHMNAGKGTGCECWTYGAASRANQMASRICTQLSSLGLKNRGVNYNSSWAEMKSVNAPNIIVETLFVDREEDVNFYNSSFEKICVAISKGIDETISLDSKDETPESQPSNIYRVVVDGTQVGAYSNKDNIINKVRTELDNAPNKIEVVKK